jgi:membrane-bound lytic murein transglycosylase B
MLLCGLASAAVVAIVYPSARAAQPSAVPLTAPADASSLAKSEIPARFMALYVGAGRRYGLEWAMLAAVGEMESQHGRSALRGVRSGANPQGAAGPMQLMPAAWRGYGLSVDGNAPMNVYDPADAINAAASFLKANGAPVNWTEALYAYNHSWRYVQHVLALAALYRRPQGHA